MPVDFKQFQEFIGSKVTQTVTGPNGYSIVAKVRFCKEEGDGKVYVEHDTPKYLGTGRYGEDGSLDWFYLDLSKATLSENDTVLSCNDDEESFIFVKKTSPMYQFTASLEGMDY